MMATLYDMAVCTVNFNNGHTDSPAALRPPGLSFTLSSVTREARSDEAIQRGHKAIRRW
jgi:hypothetical protein